MSATNGAAHTVWLVELLDEERKSVLVAELVDVAGVGSWAWERARTVFAKGEDITDPFDPHVRASLVPPEKRKR